jgi:hypothetical protein
MAIESDADRLMLLEDWGEDATYGASTITGIFDDSYSDMVDIAGSVPVFTCRTSDVTAASVAVGGTLTVSAGSYTVRALEPDGTGMTRIVLEAQS